MRKANKQESEPAKITEEEELLTAQELAPKLKLSSSTVYSLVRRQTGIPFIQPPGTKIIRFSWKSVNAWAHEIETRKRRENFEE